MTKNRRRWLPLAGCLLGLMISAPVYAQAGRVRPPDSEVKPAKPQREGAPQRIHRLESVTWNAATCELTWVVSTGVKAGGQYTPSGRQTYTIDVDTAVMQVGAERRGFEIEEAEGVHLLMDMISRYAAESTIWWESGEGERIDSQNGTVAERRRTDDRRANEQRPTPTSAGTSHVPHIP